MTAPQLKAAIGELKAEHPVFASILVHMLEIFFYCNHGTMLE
jgi:hypothetical protein